MDLDNFGDFWDFLGFFRFSLFIYHDKGAHRVVCFASCSRGQIDEDDGTVANRQMKTAETVRDQEHDGSK